MELTGLDESAEQAESGGPRAGVVPFHRPLQIEPIRNAVSPQRTFSKPCVLKRRYRLQPTSNAKHTAS